jgi:cytochrome c oxidase subunit 2
MKIFAIVSLATWLGLSAVDTWAQNAEHGAADYKLCASCHGFQGEGNQLVSAPALGGQQPWYLERQIQNFRSGIRGAASGDTHGATMAAMTGGLASAETVADVVAYIQTLPTANPAATFTADKQKGKEAFAACAACHGEKAQGNAQLNAPSLTTLDDWYQLRQLQAFKSGLRGTHTDDVYGQQMRPMASILANDAEMRNVIAYIASLR